MGSYNHSGIQAKLAALFILLNKYSVLTELSLDINGIEYQPNVCLYLKRGLSKPRDISKISELPLLVVEILSPSQPINEIIDNFEVYFSAGIKSCWLVEPVTEVVAVYSTLTQHKTFSSGEIIDETLDLRLADLRHIFDI
jgi:Uma2 family endonuclease